MLAASVDLNNLDFLGSEGKFDVIGWGSSLSSVIPHHEEMLLALPLDHLPLCHQHPLLQLLAVPQLFGHISPCRPLALSLLSGLLDELGYPGG